VDGSNDGGAVGPAHAVTREAATRRPRPPRAMALSTRSAYAPPPAAVARLSRAVRRGALTDPVQTVTWYDGPGPVRARLRPFQCRRPGRTSGCGAWPMGLPSEMQPSARATGTNLGRRPRPGAPGHTELRGRCGERHWVAPGAPGTSRV